MSRIFQLTGMSGDRQGPGFWMSVVMVLVPVFMAVLVPAVARSEKADSLCLHFSGLKENLHLELRKGFSINGDLPMTVCDISPGERWGITVDGAGLEKRKGRLSLDKSGNPRIEGERLGAMMKNAVLPGWGAVSTSRKVSGWTDFILISFSLGYFLKENFEYDDLRDDYDSLKESYESATTYEERTLLGRDLNAAALELNVQNDHRKRILYLTAAMYAYQLLDPILFNRPPGYRTQAGGSILELDTAYAGKMKAFLHSLICPGRGQFYQGKTTRGFLYAGLNAAAGFYALDRLNVYDEKSMYYEMYVDEYNSAVSLDERAYYRDKADRAWNSLEDAKRDRDISYIVLGSLWGLNLVDTFFETDHTDTSSDLGLEFGPSGAALVLSF